MTETTQAKVDQDSQAYPTNPFDDPSQIDQAFGRRIIAWTRFLVILPVAGLFVGAITLVIRASIAMAEIVWHVGTLDAPMKDALVEFIELADIYLLAIVLYIMALGLFELFIDDRLPLPAWLEFHHLDDLKEKLVSVVIVVMGVFFLGKVIEGKPALELLYLGGGISLVVASLSYFVSRVLGKDH